MRERRRLRGSTLLSRGRRWWTAHDGVLIIVVRGDGACCGCFHGSSCSSFWREEKETNDGFETVARFGGPNDNRTGLI